MRWNLAWIAPGERAQRKRLGEARHALEQEMTIGQQANEKALDELILTDDHPCHFLLERTDPSGALLHRFGDGLDSGILTARGTGHFAVVRALDGIILQFVRIAGPR